MISNLFQLTTKLVHDYIGSAHNTTLKEDVQTSENLNQYYLYKDDAKTELLMVTNICKIVENQHLVTFINKTNDKIDSILINWDEFNYKPEFPIDEINLSNDLIIEFNKKIGCETRDKSLENLFKQQIKSPVHATGDSNPKPTANFNLVDPADSSERKISDKPDFEDEYEIRGKLGRTTGPSSGAPGNFSIGDDDLYPGGIKNPQVGGLLDPLREPGNNGMSPSFDHPLFSGKFQNGRPVGARYDDPLGDGENMDLIGQGLPGFRKPRGNGPFGNDSFHPFGGGGGF